MSFIFIFRRDLRIDDNVAYQMCVKEAARLDYDVLPIFIYNKQQIDPKLNPFFSKRSFEFMNACISDLKHVCPGLTVYEGALDEHKDDVAMLSRILSVRKGKGIHAIYFNADLSSPFARNRDAKIRDFCVSKEIECLAPTTDYSLVDPSTMAKPYQKFTPFYNKYVGTVKLNEASKTSKASKAATSKASKASKAFKASKRGIALAILKRIERGDFDNYSKTRDQIWNPDGTTRLSAYMKYGCISVREAFHASRNNKALQREFMWRAFYDQIAYWFPRVLEGKSLKAQYDGIKWRGSAAHFEAWKHGRTGFPLIDAGMRQLLTTGFMHNRLRMICASFLVKSLHIDWRRGERWFATQLLDYHPASNNGGWQWASGSGADSQPYFRSFSPWIQSKKHDPDAAYIKTYVAELKDVPARDIHMWWKATGADSKYPRPCVDHTAENKKYVEMIKKDVYVPHGKIVPSRSS